MGTIEASEAAQALGLEAIDQAPDVDHVGAERVRRDAVDGFSDECIDRRSEPVCGIRDCERFHSQEYSKHLFATVPTQHGHMWPDRSYRQSRQ